jgi:hypothetical protein
MKMTSARVDYLYDVMGSAYDAASNCEVSRSLGHVPPESVGGKSHKKAIVNLDNIQDDSFKAPTGACRDAGMRRLRKDRPDLLEEAKRHGSFDWVFYHGHRLLLDRRDSSRHLHWWTTSIHTLE